MFQQTYPFTYWYFCQAGPWNDLLLNDPRGSARIRSCSNLIHIAFVAGQNIRCAMIDKTG